MLTKYNLKDKSKSRVHAMQSRDDRGIFPQAMQPRQGRKFCSIYCSTANQEPDKGGTH